MLEPIVFVPRKKPPTLLNLWIPFLMLSIFALLVSFLTENTLIVFCFTEAILFVFFVFTKSEIQVTISVEQKKFQYYYMNSWGEEKVIDIDISAATGSYKYTKISQAKTGWQLKLKNHRNGKVIISQGSFKKFQLDEMVRIINQIKKSNML